MNVLESESSKKVKSSSGLPEIHYHEPHHSERLQEKTPEEFGMEAREFFHREQQLTQQFIDQRHPQPRQAARAELLREKVLEADFTELAQLSDILLQSPTAAYLQELIDNIKDRLRNSDQFDPAQIAKLKAAKKQALNQLIVYNHAVRDFLFENGDCVFQDELVDWISKAMGNKERTARSLVSGFGVEVAVARLARDNGFNVRLSSAEEDMKGIDLIIKTPDGKVIPVDVKSGGNQSDGMSGNTREVDVETSMVRDFRVLPEHQSQVIRSLGL